MEINTYDINIDVYQPPTHPLSYQYLFGWFTHERLTARLKFQFTLTPSNSKP